MVENLLFIYKILFIDSAAIYNTVGIIPWIEFQLPHPSLKFYNIN